MWTYVLLGSSVNYNDETLAQNKLFETTKTHVEVAASAVPLTETVDSLKGTQ